MHSSTIHFRIFLLLLAAVSIAFVIVLLPFYAAIFWGVVFAVIFTPLYRRLYGSFGRRRNLAAFATLSAIILIVIIPVIFITGALASEVAGIYNRINTGQLTLGGYYEQIVSALPTSIHHALEIFGVGDLQIGRASCRERVCKYV